MPLSINSNVILSSDFVNIASIKDYFTIIIFIPCTKIIYKFEITLFKIIIKF